MMPKYIIRLAIVLASIGAYSIGAPARAGTDIEIAAALNKYQQAFNSGDIDATMSAFTKDPVVLAPGHPAAVGYEAVRALYEGQFRAIRFSIKFEIDEIQELDKRWAFARTHSDGRKEILATGAFVPGGNQELFILSRSETGEWRIARYAFSVARPGN
jgi:ketosteroid isomerase-like protein